MSTSETYNFCSPESRVLIDDAYERIGILTPLIDREKIISAQRSINFILQHWPNQGKNLWAIREAMIGLQPNQNTYSIPTNAIDLKTVALRESTRNVFNNGSPSSSAGGVAANAFDGDTSTVCTQVSSNGNISYTWDIEQADDFEVAISLVGIQSNATTNYTLVCEYSTDFGATWNTALSIPVQSYPKGVTQWFSIDVPTNSVSFRVRETGGATLNIQELYFNNSTQDKIISRFSETDYNSQVNKNESGTPSSFYVDRQITPILKVWPVPYAAYQVLYFSYWESLQDVGAMTDVAEVPARFLEALCSALAYKLAIKNSEVITNPIEKIGILKAEADQTFREATDSDRERVPTRIYPYTGYSYE